MPHADVDRAREYHRAYHAANRERENARRRANAAANSERERETNRVYREANKERLSEAARKWREKNREQIKERTRAWREANLERQRERARVYREAHAQEAIARARAWVEANPERRKEISRDYAANRRAREAECPAVENIDRAYIYARDKGRCQIAYADICLGKVPEDGWHLDHVIPISPLRPGDAVGDHTHSNTQVACPPCNSRKGNRATVTQLRLIG